MTCEELGRNLPHKPMTASSESEKSVWTEKRRRRRASPQERRLRNQLSRELQDQPSLRVTSGMLPTLQALSNLSCESVAHGRGVCLLPLEGNADAASHLQTTLLEAYCREIGLRLLRLPVQLLREAFGREHRDLSCLLLLGLEHCEHLYFLESPE